MPADWCAEHLQKAIASINNATSHPILTYGGAIEATPEAVANAVAKGQIPVWTEELPVGVMGVTNYRVTDDCLRLTLIRLSPQVVNGRLTRWADTTLTHELLHAVGVAHAREGLYPTIMAEAPDQPNFSPVLTEGDRAALAAQYVKVSVKNF